MQEKYYSTYGVKLARSRRHLRLSIWQKLILRWKMSHIRPLIVLPLFVFLVMRTSELVNAQAVYAPTEQVKIITKEVVIDKNQNVDTWIGNAVDEFLPDHASEARMIMHCLAHRENGHGANPAAHGDGGLAGGAFQFHQSTWEGMRAAMIKEGVAGDVGSRYDFKEAARTTAWAIAHGRALEWGPILRDTKGSDFATCQTPSWYRR